MERQVWAFRICAKVLRQAWTLATRGSSGMIASL